MPRPARDYDIVVQGSPLYGCLQQLPLQHLKGRRVIPVASAKDQRVVTLRRRGPGHDWCCQRGTGNKSNIRSIKRHSVSFKMIRKQAESAWELKLNYPSQTSRSEERRVGK